MTLGIIGGTGHSGLTELFTETVGSAETPWGNASARLRFQPGSDEPGILFLGRHGEQGGLPPHRINYRANVWLLREHGVSQLLSLNAVGGISPQNVAGRLMMPDQLIDYTWGRAQTFFEDRLQSSDFVDFTRPFSEQLRDSVLELARAAGVQVIAGGTYGVTQGPRLETAAEITRMERDGCDVVGMTGMPEAALAREAGLEYASLCMVVNRAAGKSPTQGIHEELGATIDTAGKSVRQILEQVLKRYG